MTAWHVIAGWAVVALLVSAFERGYLQARLKRLICWLRGHDSLLHCDDHRIFLTCHCGWKSHGVSVGPIERKHSHDI